MSVSAGLRLLLTVVLSSAALLLAGLSLAAPAVADEHDPRAALAKKFPELTPEKMGSSPIPGLLEIRIGSTIAYLTEDGRYLVQGEIIDLTNDVNITAARRNSARSAVLAGIPESEMVIFAPAKYTSTITVFTDIDCGYCRKLHREIADYNARGIRVRYLFFPRSGPGTQSWTKAEQVWCAGDRKAALTRAKLGETLTTKSCTPTPVAGHYQTGRDFGIQGTPAILLESGELIGGYLEPKELATYIAETAKIASR